MVSSHPLHFLFDLILARTRQVDAKSNLPTWNEHFVVSKGKNPMFEPSTNDKSNAVSSEAQKAECSLPLRLLKKATGPKVTSDRLINIIQIIALSTQLMSWKQTSEMEKQR